MIGCIVMAAGLGERFPSGNKLATPLNGKTVLQRTLDALPTEALETVAVIRDSALCPICEKAGVRPVQYSGGPRGETIRAGLTALGLMDGYLFVNGDQPLLRRTSMIAMLECFHQNPEAIFRLAFGETQGNPVLFPSGAREMLLGLTASQTGRDVIRSGLWPVIPVQAEFEWELWDMDTPEDFSTMLKIIHQMEG